MMACRQLDEPQLGWADTGENALKACHIKPLHMLEEPCKHRAVVRQHRIITVLEQVRLFDLDQLAQDSATIDPAAHHPINAAMTVVGAAIAILAEGTAEFRNHDHDRIAPFRLPDLLGKS